MTAAARVVFAALVCATLGAFFVTQRLKRTPPVVQSVERTRFFSPNGDGVRDVAKISFKVRRADDVTAAVVDGDGGTVRLLAQGRRVSAYGQLRLRWDGRTDAGGRAPDGLYRLRVGLRRQGRSVTVPASITLDTRPPRPLVTSIGPSKAFGPELLPRRGVREVTIRFRGPVVRAPEFLVYRTDVTPPRLVATFRGRPRRGGGVGTWDGTLAGRRAPAGTYLVAVRVPDRAGNVGASPPRLPPRGARAPGRGGVTIRRLAALPPLEPVLAGARAEFLVDARGRRYSWRVRRLGAARPVKRGVKSTPFLRLRVPRGISGVYLLELRTRREAAAVPFAVQARKRRRVLVVLPALTWQGRNPVDDDGDGLPNTLDAGAPVRLERVFQGAGGLPRGFTATEAPLLVYLDRAGLRYDLTTDLALARGRGPGLEGRPGVILAGDERWLTRDLQLRLRRFVQAGGKVYSAGTESLRRRVRIGARRALGATAPAPVDVFGARIRPLERRRADLLVFPGDEIRLFAGTDGLFSGYTAFEETASVGEEGDLVAAAGVQTGRPTLVAYRLGDGLVIRTGLPELPARLGSDRNAAELMRRIWTLVSR